MSKRSRRRTWLTAVVAVVLAVPAPALAAGSGAGGGESGSGGAGGGETTGDTYSDLVRILRAGNGTPVLKKYVVPATAETPATTEYCVQPVSYQQAPGLVTTPNPADGSTVYAIPLQGEWLTSGTVPAEEVTACDPQPAYAMFVNEVELERLNMARTSDSVMDDKLAAVQTKLELAGDKIALDPAGRITADGVPIDAAPEQAAIYQSLMKTGTIPGLPDDMTGPTRIGPAETPGHNSRFDAWELAAAAVGTAASKGVPINIDSIEYYNQVIGFPPDDAYASDWGVSFVRPLEPGTETAQPTGQRYVDYSGFRYDRAETFPGSVTWLDVASLEWHVTPILQAVPFTNPGVSHETLHGVQAFAQLADDTRAVISYLHEHEVVLPGFSMDPVGTDTTEAQLEAVHDPAVDLGALPADVFATQPFDVTASLFNPHATTTDPELGGQLIDHARLRLTVHAGDALATGEVTAAADGQALPFAAEGGDLVGWWGPETGFPVPPGYHVSTTVEATVADGAPTGPYEVTLQLVDVDNDAQVLATDHGTITVHANQLTLLWGGEVPAVATQGSYVAVPLLVHAPTAGTAEIRLGVTGPDGVTPEAGQVAAYGSSEDGAAMTVLPLAEDGAGRVATTWRVPVQAGDTALTWYLLVAPGAPEGGYALDAGLVGGERLDSRVVAMTAPETHGESPSVAVRITVSSVGADPSFTLSAVPADTTGTFQCRLGVDGQDAAWEQDCGTAPSAVRTYSDLGPGTYEFSARLKLGSSRMSEIASVTWTVPDDGTTLPPSDGEDTTPPATGGGDTTPPSTGGGDSDTTAPIVTVTSSGLLTGTATFLLTSDDPTATFTCRLTTDGTTGQWEPCDGTVIYQALEPGSYLFEARATDPVGNVSTVATRQWTVTTEPAGHATAPRTSVAAGPRNHAWVLAHSATFRLRSDAPGARFRVRVNAGPVRTCTADRCRVTGLVAGTSRIRFAAVANGMVDRTPVVRYVSVPRGVLALRRHQTWRVGRDGQALFGHYARTRTHHRTLALWAPRVRRVALVVSTGPRAGAVDVYLGSRRLTRTPLRLASRTRQSQVVVPVATFARARKGLVRVVVVSRHRTVRVEGIAVATR